MGRLGLERRETRRASPCSPSCTSHFIGTTKAERNFQSDDGLDFQEEEEEENEMHRKPDHQHGLAFYIGLNAALGCLIIASVLLAGAA